MRFCENPRCIRARIGWMQANAFGYCSSAFECDEMKQKKGVQLNRICQHGHGYGYSTMPTKHQRPLMQLGSEPVGRGHASHLNLWKCEHWTFSPWIYITLITIMIVLNDFYLRFMFFACNIQQPVIHRAFEWSPWTKAYINFSRMRYWVSAQLTQ